MYIKISIKKNMDNFFVLPNYVGQRHYAIDRSYVSNVSECLIKGNVLNGNKVELTSVEVENMENTLKGFINEAKIEAMPQYKLCFAMDNDVFAMPFICDGNIALINIELVRMVEKRLNVKYYANGTDNRQIVAVSDNKVVGIFCAMRFSQEKLLKAVNDLASTKTCRIF